MLNPTVLAGSSAPPASVALTPSSTSSTSFVIFSDEDKENVDPNSGTTPSKMNKAKNGRTPFSVLMEKNVQQLDRGMLVKGKIGVLTSATGTKKVVQNELKSAPSNNSLPAVEIGEIPPNKNNNNNYSNTPVDPNNYAATAPLAVGLPPPPPRNAAGPIAGRPRPRRQKSNNDIPAPTGESPRTRSSSFEESNNNNNNNNNYNNNPGSNYYNNNNNNTINNNNSSSNYGNYEYYDGNDNTDIQIATGYYNGDLPASLQYQPPPGAGPRRPRARASPPSSQDGDNSNAAAIRLPTSEQLPPRTNYYIETDDAQIPGRVPSIGPSPGSSQPPSPNSTRRTTPRSQSEGKLRWRKGEILGSGSFGRVFKGLNQLTGEMMAVKQVSFEPGDFKAAEKIAAEVDIMKRLTHPNIVRYLGTETDAEDGSLYIFMEFVTGGSLLSIIQKFGLVEEPLARIYSEQALYGLLYLHDSGIIHRDVKTANILVDDQGNAKLADFGASKVMEGSVTVNQKSMEGIQGTPVFMPPEVVLQKSQGRKSDIWSMGCTVLHMVTGKFPWVEKGFSNPAAVLFVIASTNELPGWDRAALSPELTEFLEHMFQRDTELRWTAAQLLKHKWIVDGPSERR